MSQEYMFICDVCGRRVTRTGKDRPPSWRSIEGGRGHACEICVRALGTVLRGAAYKLRNDLFLVKPEDSTKRHQTKGSYEHIHALILSICPQDLEEPKGK